MSRLFYIASILLLFLQSCTKDFGDNSSMDMGDPVRLTFNIDRVESGLFRSERQSKTPIHLDIRSLEVWVFDHNGIFRECGQTSLLGPDSDGKKTYSVVLHSSDQSCRVHFVANYSIFDKFDSEFKGRTEASVFSSIRLNKGDIKDSIVPMWGYVKDVVINQKTQFSNDNGDVRLIPSVSFISLSIDPSLAAQLKPLGYVLYNSCQEGLLAGYSGLLTNNTLDFDESAFTPVTQSIRSDIPSESDFISIDTPLIVFEQDNHLIKNQSRVPYLILKAEVEGKIKYIKLDLVNMFYDHEGQLNYSRYDVRRNKALDIYINKSIGILNKLPDNINGAIQSLPANNTALSMDHLSSPVINDGNARLKVERVYYVLRKQEKLLLAPNGKRYKLRFTAQYFPDKSNDLDNIDESAVKNEDISCVKVSPNSVIRDCFVIKDESTHKAYIYVDYYNVFGVEASILVYVKNRPGLVRKISFVVVDNLYLDAKVNPGSSRSVMLPDPDFNPNPDDYNKPAPKKQFLDVGSPFELEVGFPANFPKSVLPIDLLVYTDKLVPSDNFMLYELVPNTHMETNICFRTKIYSFDGDLFETNESGEHVMRMKFLTSKYLDYKVYEAQGYHLQIQTSPRNMFENFSPNLQPDNPSLANENDYCLFVNLGFQVAPLKN